jgi:hypothetical protein
MESDTMKIMIFKGGAAMTVRNGLALTLVLKR